MTSTMNFTTCQKQQKERACKQRVFLMPLGMSGTGGKLWTPPGDTD